jgi:hypothetical protein
VGGRRDGPAGFEVDRRRKHRRAIGGESEICGEERKENLEKCKQIEKSFKNSRKSRRKLMEIMRRTEENHKRSNKNREIRRKNLKTSEK